MVGEPGGLADWRDLRAVVRTGAPLGDLTTLRVGGAADLLCPVANPDHARRFQAFALENDLPFYARHQIAVIPYQPLKGGLLSGRYRRDKARNEEGLIAGWKPAVTDEDLDKIEALAALAEEAGLALRRIALKARDDVPERPRGLTLH